MTKTDMDRSERLAKQDGGDFLRAVAEAERVWRSGNPGHSSSTSALGLDMIGFPWQKHCMHQADALRLFLIRRRGRKLTGVAGSRFWNAYPEYLDMMA